MRLIWPVPDFADALHPTRLVAAVLATATVAVTSVLTAVCAPWFGVSGVALPALIGGISALNGALFLPPGALAGHPNRALLLLCANVVPMPVAVLLFHITPPLAGAAVVLTASLAMLARASGPIAGALSLLSALNVVVPLVLGAEPALYIVGPLGGLLGTVAAVLADYMAVWLERRIAARAEQAVLSQAAGAFLEELAQRLRSPEASPRLWFIAHRERVRTIVADEALGLPAELVRPARAADQFVGAIATCAEGLWRGEPGNVADLALAASEAADGVAQALRRRSADDAKRCAQDLLGRARQAMAEGQAAAGSRVLGLAVLLRDFADAVLGEQDSAPTLVASKPEGLVWPGRVEWRLAAQVAVSLTLAVTVSNLAVGPKPYWIPLTALIVGCASFGESLLKSLERAFGTVAGLLVGQLAWIVLRDQPEAMIGVIAVGVFGIFFSRTGPYRWMLFWLTVALSGLLHLSDVGPAFYLARLRDTVIGGAIALTVGRIVLPLRTASAARERCATYLGAVAGQLRRLVNGPPDPGAEPLNEQAVSALASLHGLASAEIVEAGVSRQTRLTVRRRLAEADRLARCVVALSTISGLAVFPGDPETASLVLRLADAAAGRAEPPDGETIRTRETALIAGARSDADGTERLAASLRVLRLVGVMSDAVIALREVGAIEGQVAGR